MVAGNQQAGKAGNCSGLPPKRIRDYAVWEFSSSTIHDLFSFCQLLARLEFLPMQHRSLGT